MKVILKYSVLLISSVLVMLILRPISNPSVENSIQIKGEVSQVAKGAGIGDIEIRLKNDTNTYYINRGLELGLTIDTIKEKVESKEITLLYADHWTPLDPKNENRHITRLEVEDETVYNEIKQ